ncbi:MAG: hypothetical protein QNJ04_09980 [Desulfobacterales bacterium]|nr:hypothetical protein [Desulfobacterales bacterium]
MLAFTHQRDYQLVSADRQPAEHPHAVWLTFQLLPLWLGQEIFVERLESPVADSSTQTDARW